MISRKRELNVHLYANDTQLYVTFNPSDEMDIEEAIVKVEGCIADVKKCMSSNFKLNDDKTEILLLSKRDIKQLPSILIGNMQIQA